MKAGFAGGTKPKVRWSDDPEIFLFSLVSALLKLSPYLSFILDISFKVLIGTKVGRTKHQRVMPGGALEGEEHRLTATSGGGGRKSSTISIRCKPSVGVTSYFVGRKLDEHRGAFLLEHPMERGRIVDGGWDAMELLWEVSVLTFYEIFFYVSLPH